MEHDHHDHHHGEDRMRAELEACRARARWHTDWMLMVVALCLGVVLGAGAVLLLPQRYKCELKCT
tara:strand:+ start:504 stop:698 length:195 start_codon:yes stop_codon:yes gene_type:complete